MTKGPHFFVKIYIHDKKSTPKRHFECTMVNRQAILPNVIKSPQVLIKIAGKYGSVRPSLNTVWNPDGLLVLPEVLCYRPSQSGSPLPFLLVMLKSSRTAWSTWRHNLGWALGYEDDGMRASRKLWIPWIRRVASWVTWTYLATVQGI